MRSLLLAASLLIATPALSTEWVYCGDAGDNVSVGLLVGGFDFAAIVGITLRIGTEEWASNEAYGPGAPIAVGQAYFGDDQIVVDLADDNQEAALVELRVYQADEGDDYVQGGVLRAPGRGAWIVSCEGP